MRQGGENNPYFLLLLRADATNDHVGGVTLFCFLARCYSQRGRGADDVQYQGPICPYHSFNDDYFNAWGSVSHAWLCNEHSLMDNMSVFLSIRPKGHHHLTSLIWLAWECVCTGWTRAKALFVAIATLRLNSLLFCHCRFR
jgi:hypothetical protein